MYGGCLEGCVCKVSGLCLNGDWMVSDGCPDGVWTSSGGGLGGV